MIHRPRLCFIKNLGILLLGINAGWVSPSSAFTLSIFGTDTPAAGWGKSSLTFDIDYTNCPSVTVVNNAVDAAAALWNGIPNANLSVSRGASISTTVAAATSTTHEAGNPLIICDPNFSTTLGQSGIEDVSPGVALNGLADGTGKILYYTILINAQVGARANISVFDSTLAAVILGHEMGHVLGLGHSASSNALMYYNASAKTVFNLSQDDVDGVAFLYPRNEPISGGAFACGTLAKVGENGNRQSFLAQLELLMFVLVCAWGTGKLRRPGIISV